MTDKLNGKINITKKHKREEKKKKRKGRIVKRIIIQETRST